MVAASSSVINITNYTTPFPGRERSSRNARIGFIITVNIVTSVIVISDYVMWIARSPVGDTDAVTTYLVWVVYSLLMEGQRIRCR